MPSICRWLEDALAESPPAFIQPEEALAFLHANESVEGKTEAAIKLLRKVAEKSECYETWERLVKKHLIPAEEAMRILLPRHRDHVIHSAFLYLLGVGFYIKMIRKERALLAVLADSHCRDAHALMCGMSFQYDCHTRIVDETDFERLKKTFGQAQTCDDQEPLIKTAKAGCPDCIPYLEELASEAWPYGPEARKYLQLNAEDMDELFARRWGMIALLHDCAYPLELAAEQIVEYLKDTVGGLGCPFSQCPTPVSMVFNRMSDLIALPLIQNLCDPRIDAAMYSDDAIELIATNLSHKLHVEYSSKTLATLMTESLERAIANGRIDHGVFSGLLMLRWMNREVKKKLANVAKSSELIFDNPARTISGGKAISAMEFYYVECVDAAAAIYLHNTKKYIEFFKNRPIDFVDHPYAWVLFLCDQLQECWRPSGLTCKNIGALVKEAEGHKIVLDDGPRVYFDFPGKGGKVNDEIREHLKLFGEDFIKAMC